MIKNKYRVNSIVKCNALSAKNSSVKKGRCHETLHTFEVYVRNRGVKILM